ncbi:MAG: OmpA family protein [Kiloniellales bacterium]
MRSSTALTGGRRLATAIALATGLAAASSLAQTGYGGAGAGPPVEVDLSVLDSLGQTPPTPGLLPRALPRYDPPAAPAAAPGSLVSRPVGAPSAAGAGLAPQTRPLPPPGPEGLKRMQQAINAWALGAAAAGSRVAPVPATAETPTPSPGPAVPPPARVVPPAASAELLITAPPRPMIPESPAPPTRLAPTPQAAPSAPQPVTSAKAPAAPAASIARGPPPDTAPSPPPAPASATAPAPPGAPQPPQQTAARSPVALPPGTFRVHFDGESSELAEAAKPGLDAIAERLASEPKLRIQLQAFAEGDKVNAGQARRLSLYRALAVRSYLIDKGIPSARMYVRALGSGYEEGPGNRVDVVLVER